MSSGTSKPNFEIINYNLRPAKSAERKMLCEAFARLSHFRDLIEYQYIGFGSTYFTDFRLMHKVLGIRKMYSIEKDIIIEEDIVSEERKKRFEFNRPYNCIEILPGHSNEVIPNIDFSPPTIIWLDYTSKLNQEVFTDISRIIPKLVSGSIFAISVNATPFPLDSRMNRLSVTLGDRFDPSQHIAKNLDGWGTANLYRDVIDVEVRKLLIHRNTLISNPDDRYEYTQLFNFEYADKQKMTTIGGIIYRVGDKQALVDSGIRTLEFIRDSSEPFRIEIPNLTLGEVKHLEKNLPEEASPKIDWIPREDQEKFEALYRYYPTFAETDY